MFQSRQMLNLSPYPEDGWGRSAVPEGVELDLLGADVRIPEDRALGLAVEAVVEGAVDLPGSEIGAEVGPLHGYLEHQGGDVSGIDGGEGVDLVGLIGVQVLAHEVGELEGAVEPADSIARIMKLIKSFQVTESGNNFAILLGLVDHSKGDGKVPLQVITGIVLGHVEPPEVKVLRRISAVVLLVVHDRVAAHQDLLGGVGVGDVRVDGEAHGELDHQAVP